MSHTVAPVSSPHVLLQKDPESTLRRSRAGPSQPSGQPQLECGNGTGNEQRWRGPTETSTPKTDSPDWAWSPRLQEVEALRVLSVGRSASGVGRVGMALSPALDFLPQGWGRVGGLGQCGGLYSSSPIVSALLAGG